MRTRGPLPTLYYYSPAVFPFPVAEFASRLSPRWYRHVFVELELVLYTV